MLKFFILGFPALLVLAQAPFAFGSAEHVREAYLQTQEALASDQLPSAIAAAKRLAAQTKVERKSAKATDRETYGKIAAAAESISKAPDLARARKDFKTLSEVFVHWAKQHPSQDTEIMQCTMYPGTWVQKKGETRNPYYGKEMLSCGEPAQ